MVSLASDAAARGHQVSVIYSPDRADAQMIQALRDGGVESLHPSHMQRSIGPWDVLDGLRLRRTIAALGPLDVLHSHSSKAGALARAFGRRRGTAQVYSPHGFYTMTGQAPFYIGPVERALSHLSDRIIAVSDFERRHAITLGIAPRRVVVVPNGIKAYDPLKRSEARSALGLPEDLFVIGFVGRLTEQKNPLEALHVVDAMPTEAPIILAIIGDGELRAAAEQAADSHGSRARFLGGRNARPLMAAFDCLLCTSRYEGMPVSFLEALNCGVPIISYPVGGTEELVIDGTTGFLTAEDAGAAAAAIVKLMGLGARERGRMSTACRGLAAQYSDEEMGRRTLDVYESVLSRGSSSC